MLYDPVDIPYMNFKIASNTFCLLTGVELSHSLAPFFAITALIDYQNYEK
jgi:hypothetical protein